MRKSTGANLAAPADGASDSAAGGVSIDAHIGARIRARRRGLELTQDNLANRVGVTAQQIHKYENGSNRVSASKLFEIGAALALPMSDFFDGLPCPSDVQGPEGRSKDRLLVDKDLLALATSSEEIEEERIRRVVMKIIKAAANTDQRGDN